MITCNMGTSESGSWAVGSEDSNITSSSQSNHSYNENAEPALPATGFFVFVIVTKNHFHFLCYFLKYFFYFKKNIPVNILVINKTIFCFWRQIIVDALFNRIPF